MKAELEGQGFYLALQNRESYHLTSIQFQFQYRIKIDFFVFFNNFETKSRQSQTKSNITRYHIFVKRTRILDFCQDWLKIP